MGEKGTRVNLQEQRRRSMQQLLKSATRCVRMMSMQAFGGMNLYIDDMVLEELEVCVRAMQDLKKNVAARINLGNDHFGNQNMVHFDVGGVIGFSLEDGLVMEGGY